MTMAAIIAQLARFRAWISIRISDWFRFDIVIGGGNDPPDDSG